MMWQVILYSLGVSVALSLAGFCEEMLSAMQGRSRRFFWAASMMLSIIWPLGMMLWVRPDAVATPVVAVAPPVPHGTLTPADTQAREGAAAQSSVSGPMHRQWHLPLPSDRTTLLAWAVASAALLLGLAGTDLLLRCRALRWRRETVLGRQVLVSELTGPALLGAWRPQIVLPRWLLDEPAAAQRLILEHEQQHIAARDPLLLRMALYVVAVVPWNLPLWWQLRRLRQAIELDCDARVLRAGAEADSYGKVLLAVTQRAGNVPAGVIAMGEPVSALERRIRNLTAGSASYRALHALAAVVFWAVGVGVAFALQAPALPRSAARIAVHDAVAVSQPPLAQVLPSLVAAQAQPSPDGGSAPRAARLDEIQTVARLPPPATPLQPDGRVEIAERRFGAVRFVIGAGQAMQWLEMYSDGNLIAAFRDFAADDVIASPDRRHFLALSNSTKSAYAFAVIDGKGRIEASSPHGGDLHYCQRTAWGIGEWFDAKQPGATFSIEKNELTSPATDFVFVTVRGCDGKTVALTRASALVRDATPVAGAGLRNPDVSGAQADGNGFDGVARAAFFIGNTIANLRGLDPTFGDRTLTLVDGRRTLSPPLLTRALSLPANWTDDPVSERLACVDINNCSASGDLLVTRADGSTLLLATGIAGDYIALPHSHRIFACADRQVLAGEPPRPAIVDLGGTRTVLPAHPGPVRICRRAGSGEEVLLVYTVAQAGVAYTLARVFDGSGGLLAEVASDKADIVRFRIADKTYSEAVPGP